MDADTGEADVTNPEAVAEAVTVTYSTSSALPEGVTLGSNGILSGEVAAGTSFTLTVNVLADCYRHFSYDVTVNVV